MSTLTEDQRAAVECAASVAITAGAGSGKTHVLAERLMRLLERRVSPASVLAVTFTEAAAGELRGRVEAYAAEREASSADAGWWRRVRDELPTAQISTIHALCARIAREHPLESGLGLGFTVLDEAEGLAWTAERFRELAPGLPDEVFEIVPAGAAFRTLLRLLREPERARAAFASLPASTPEGLLAAWRSAADERRLARWALVRDEWFALVRTLEAHAATDETDALEAYRRSVLEYAATVEPSDPYPEILEVDPALAGFRTNHGKAGSWRAGGREEVRAALARMRELARDEDLQCAVGEADEWLSRALPALGAAFEAALTALDAAKAEDEVATYADLLRGAARALTHEQVRAYYRERYTVVLIDEFQDTAPEQWAVLGALADPAGGLNLTLVGDEKQSIYGFTGATPALFRMARELIALAGGGSFALSTSFRTHAELVKHANETFARLFGDANEHFAPLEAHRAGNPAAPQPSLEVHVVAAKADASELREGEARLLAQRIHSLVRSGRRVHARGRDEGAADACRPVQYADTAILFRARTSLATYEEALAAAGIPYAVVGGGGLLARREVADARALLDFLECPADDLALTTVLRGPYFARPDDDLRELAELRRFGPRGERREDLWDALARAEAPGLSAARGTLEALLEQRALLAPDALLERADALTGFSAAHAMQFDGERRLANLERFSALLRRWAAGGLADLAGLRARLEDYETLGVPLAEATPDGDAVRLLTLHGAKGLEFPVVMIADLVRLDNDKRDYQLLLDPEGGLALPYVDERAERHYPILWRLLEEAGRARERRETDRLLYVGFTRARDLLVISSGQKLTENASAEPSPSEAFLAALPQAGVARYLYAPERIPALGREAEGAPSGAGRVIPGLGLILPERLPVTSIAVYRDCPRRFRYRFLDGLEPLEREWLPLPEPDEDYGGRAGAATVGTLTHLALERDITDARQLARAVPGTPDGTAETVMRLVAAAHQPPFDAIWADKKAERERPCSLALDGLTLEGVIDLWSRAGGWIVDYKTDRLPRPEHHLPQLAVYAAARGAKRASLAYLQAGVLHDFTTDDLARGLEQAREAVAGMRAGVFPAQPTPAKCGFCPFAGDCPEASGK